MIFETKLLSSLEKVFSSKAPEAEEFSSFSCLKGERFSFQLAMMFDLDAQERAAIRTPRESKAISILEVKAKLSSPFGGNVYAVEDIPVEFPCYIHSDDYFISREPGLYPDILRDIKTRKDGIRLYFGKWRSLWVEVDVPADCEAGEKELILSLTTEEGEILAERSFTLNVIDALLPKQDLKCTLWFHNDALVDWYQVPVFSDEYWKILNNYMANFRRYGCNMILTPIFTPPLDTAIGGERTTIQLVDVTKTADGYEYGFENLEKYIDMALKNGIEYFEISHLFTQWGAKATPKIVTTEGERIFGWDVSATGGEYEAFVIPMLRALKAYLKEKGVLDNCYFHISDEPVPENLDTYMAAHAIVCDELSDCHVMDALSHPRFYEEGLVRLPIASNTHVQEFIDRNISPLWTYYCCGQSAEYEANRFIAMPSARSRILGIQLFKYDIDGFLQWGYNFWNSRLSLQQLNPYHSSDADYGYPSGDSTIVYPGDDGAPVISLRQIVFNEAFQDLRALRYLENHMGHEEIVAWLEELSGQPFTFTDYPHGSEYLLFIREAINSKIAGFTA